MNKYQEAIDFCTKYGATFIVNKDGKIEVAGDLDCRNNLITSIPEGLVVGGDFYCSNNQITSIPEGLVVGGGFSCIHNQITSIHEGRVVGGDFYCSNNQITSIPEGLKVGGVIDYTLNQITSIPEGFVVGGGFFCSHNQITSIPEGLVVGRDFDCSYNQITSIPEGLVVGRHLNCSHNQIHIVPKGVVVGGDLYGVEKQPRPEPTTFKITKTWCVIDGIVRKIISKKTAGDLTIIKTPLDFIVGKGEVWAHGVTLEKATSDYQFKLVEADPESLDIDPDQPMSHSEAVNLYRAITRSCEEGIRLWMSDKTFPEPITVRQIIEITEGAYGGDVFKAFFESR